MAENFPRRKCGKHEKNKAENLMPERMHRLNCCGNNMFYELSRLLREILVAHYSMLSKGVVVASLSGLYNQGEIGLFCGHLPVLAGKVTDGPAVASQTVAISWIAPDERGRTWKNVSKA